MIQCKFCSKVSKSSSGNGVHEIYCKENPNKIIKAPTRDCNSKISNQYIKAKELGLPKPSIDDTTRQKLSEYGKERKWSDEDRLKHSITMKKVVAENPESYTSSNRGRSKQIIYKDIKFQGTWELEFYKWCENNKIKIKRNDERFYYNWNGKRTYNPDFYLEELNLYVEVKGYKTDRDIAKWRDFPYDMKIVMESDIKRILSNSFDTSELLNDKEKYVT